MQVLSAAKGDPKRFILYLMLLGMAVRPPQRPRRARAPELTAAPAQLSAVLTNVTAPLVLRRSRARCGVAAADVARASCASV